MGCSPCALHLRRLAFTLPRAGSLWGRRELLPAPRAPFMQVSSCKGPRSEGRVPRASTAASEQLGLAGLGGEGHICPRLVPVLHCVRVLYCRVPCRSFPGNVTAPRLHLNVAQGQLGTLWVCSLVLQAAGCLAPLWPVPEIGRPAGRRASPTRAGGRTWHRFWSPVHTKAARPQCAEPQVPRHGRGTEPLTVLGRCPLRSQGHWARPGERRALPGPHLAPSDLLNGGCF